jgi:hypothetical protein
MNNPLNRPMFANGGSVYLSPALRYMAQNPDVFEASVANARARGLSGINSQGQVERDAALHYAFHGKGEGRQYGGRTFLGGLLEPRLGDTFGLSLERKQELENERDGIANLPVDLPDAPAEGLVSLVPLDPAFQPSGMAEGGEVYESSPVVQGYLQANPDVLNNSVRVAREQGLPPGQGFQRAVENAAREHWNTFGKNEGRTISGYADNGASLMSQEQIATNQGILANPVNERMLAIAQLLQGTRNVFDDPENMEGTAFFGTNPQGGFYNPYQQQTTQEIDNLLTKISPSLRRRVVTGNSPGDSDEDMVARDMDPVLRGLFQKRGTQNRSLFDNLGGQGELLRAYAQLGIEPPDVSGQRGTQEYGQAMVYDTIGGTPLSLAGQDLTGILNAVNQERSSIGADGTGGASAIGQGGEFGGGYKTFGDAIADLPNMMQQLAAVPTVNPLGIANQLYQMYTGNFMENPYEQERQVMRNLQFASPGNPESMSSPSFAGLGATSF